LKSGDETETYNWNFVDIAAPGARILSTTMGAGYEYWDGTSMATPLVAGAAARVWDKAPTWNATQVRTQLVNTGKVLGAANGFPLAERRLDLLKALGGTVSGGYIGTILNGETGNPEANVKVEALNPANAVVGTPALTNGAGMYVLSDVPPLTSGSYRLRMTKGLVSLIHTAGNTVAGNLVDFPVRALAPSRPTTASDENWRIIAFWPQTQPGYDYWALGWNYGGYDDYYPYTYYHAPGLEANAYLKDPTGVVYYYQNPGSLSSAPFTKYLHDSFRSTPIETHVIRDQRAGTYKYWLNLDPNDWGWGSVKYNLGSPAKPGYPAFPIVQVYKGNTPVKTILASAATRLGTGSKYWNVLTLNGNTVTEVNQVTDTLP
jgi:hypothetical protein